MKLLIKLLFFVVAQRLFLDAIFAQQLERGGGNDSYVNSSIWGEHVGESGKDLLGAQLLTDSIQTSAVGQQEGKDVRFIGPGNINLTLSDDGLVLQIWTSCLGSVHVCYESLDPKFELLGNCPLSHCALEIDGFKKVPNGASASIEFGPNTMASYPNRDSKNDYGEIAIKGVPVLFKEAANIKTCQPKIVNNVIQLSVATTKHSATTCPVKAIGAKIKFPEIITTSKPRTSPKLPSSTPAPSKPDSTAEGSFPLWAIIVIVVGFLLVILAVGIVAYCCFKERQSSKTPVPSAFEAPVAVVTTNDAKESTVSTQAPPPPSKPEPEKKTVEKDAPTLSKEPVQKPHVENKANEKKPSQEPEKKTVEKDAPTISKEPVKKQQVEKKPEKKVVKEKKTTIEPTTTEELAPPAQEKPPPYNYPPPHVVPRSRPGSHRTSSVEDAIERNKLIPVESVADSLSRNCIKPGDAAIVGKMKKHYPEVMRVRWRHEIVLFCIAISEMFQTLIDMAAEYEDILVGLGVVFDAQHRIVSMTAEARRYILDPKNPGTCMLFAFGAEYHNYVTDDMKLMHKFSVPHLMAIALQPRFPDYHRRKACTWLRRELPKIRENYTIAERKAMSFPISIIEEAFILDPKYLLDTNGLDTDSEADRRKNEEAQKEWLKKKNEGRGADGKRKKKSSKKRH